MLGIWNYLIPIEFVIYLALTLMLLKILFCFYTDIAQMYSKFVGPLPSSIKEFALSIHKIFPHIVDTRHLMSVDQAVQKLMERKSKSLSSAFSFLCPASDSYAMKPSSLSPVKIEVEGDETKYVFFWIFDIFRTSSFLLTFDMLVWLCPKLLWHVQRTCFLNVLV